MKSKPRKQRARKATLEPKRLKDRRLNDQDAEEWMIGQPADDDDGKNIATSEVISVGAR